MENGGCYHPRMVLWYGGVDSIREHGLPKCIVREVTGNNIPPNNPQDPTCSREPNRNPQDQG